MRDEEAQPRAPAEVAQEQDERAGAPDPAAGLRAAELAIGRMTGTIAAERNADPERAGEVAHRDAPILAREMAGRLARETAGRRAPGPDYESAAFERLMDQSTHSRARDDSDADMLFDGANSFPARARLIQSARHTIYLETFGFLDDDAGRSTAEMLIAAVRRGVKVRVIYDAVGSLSAESSTREDIFDRMRAGGVELQCFRPAMTTDVRILNKRNHVKSLVVDGRVGIFGGMNIGDPYAQGGSFGRRRDGRRVARGWRDADVQITGRAVSDEVAQFARDWARFGRAIPQAELARARAAAGSVSGADADRVRIIRSRPIDRDRNDTNAYLAAIRSAERSIEIEASYFIPPVDVKQELIRAARRGVRVRVMTNGRSVTDNTAGVDIARHGYYDLVAAGVEIHERQTNMVHAKTATFDGVFTLIGSMNLNRRSDDLDEELVVAITDREIAGQTHRRFETGLQGSDHVTADELEQTSRAEQLRQWSLSALAWTF